MTKTEKLSEIKLFYKPKHQAQTVVAGSQDAYKKLLGFYNRNTIAAQEQFVVLYMNRANAVLGGHLCSTGGLTGTVADIRLILGIALKACACNIIISHNHPSGNLKPSMADREITTKLKEAGKLMDISLLDHIIISPYEGQYFSFADEGEF
jgi:DNA repair protein RadC